MRFHTLLGFFLSLINFWALFATAQSLPAVKQVGSPGKGRFTARVPSMPSDVQGAGETVAACRAIARQYHDKIITEFGQAARTGGALVVAAVWDRVTKEFFVSSVPHEANFISDAEKAGQRWLEVYNNLRGPNPVIPHAEDGAYSLWENKYNVVSPFTQSRLENGRYPTNVLIVGTYGSDTSSSFANFRRGKSLPLCSAQSFRGRLQPSCQALAAELPVTFQDTSSLSKR